MLLGAIWQNRNGIATDFGAFTPPKLGLERQNRGSCVGWRANLPQLSIILLQRVGSRLLTRR